MKTIRAIAILIIASLAVCAYAFDKTEVGPYTVEMISDNVYHIQDCNSKNPSGETFNEQGEKTHFNNCSDMYLLVGNEKALLIDLSNFITWDKTAVKSLRKIVKKYGAGKPLTVTFTHNHGDHTGMLPAFVNDKKVQFALPRVDFEGLKEKFPDVSYTFIDGGYAFDLGGMKVNTLLVPGHTHGSMVFFLEGRDMVFTGDAIGSGHGVWIFNTEGFREYAEAVPQLIKYVEDPANGINTDKLQIWGGHYWQKDWFEKDADKDINWQYVKDMQMLINQVKFGAAKHEPSNLNVRNLDTYFRNNHAIIVWNLKEAEDYSKSLPRPQFPRMPQKAPAENYELKACDGHASMLIDAANGARIMSLKWDEKEVLSQNPAPNMYGSTFWTSPQKEWNWPPVREHDMGRYTVEQHDGKIIMTGSVPERIPLRISKTFSVVDGKMFCITYSIKNEGTEDRKVAPWEVTRVPGDGEIAFNAKTESIWPVGLMDFSQKGKSAVFAIDKVDKQRKINANGEPGKADGTLCDGMSIMTYTNNNLILTKRFPDLKEGEAAPGEDEIQVYVHQNALYCEIEEQGAFTLLHPGEQLEWTVYWQLEPTK